MSESEEPPDTTARPVLQILAFGAVYLIWGSTYLAIHIGVATLPPFLLAGCRHLLAGAILFALLRLRGVRAPDGSEWLRSIPAGVAMLTVGNGMVAWAQQGMPSSVAALLVAAVPLHVALLDWVRPAGQRPRPRVFVGIAVGAVGLALLARPGTGAANGWRVIAVLIAGLAWAAGSLYARYGVRPAHALMGSAQQMIAGGLACLLVAAARGERAAAALAGASGASVLAFVYLTLFGSLVAFTAFGWLMKVSTPARVSTAAYVNPLVAVLLGWAVLGERLSGRAMTGAGLIVCAVVVMTVPLARRV